MPRIYAMSGKRREFQMAVGDVWGVWCAPYFDYPANGDSEMTSVGSKRERSHLAAEAEVVERDSPGHIGEDGVSVEVDGEQKIAFGVERKTRYVLSVGKRKGVRLGTVALSADSSEN